MAADVTTFQGSILMIVTMFGGGILMMPSAFFAIGWLQGTCIFTIIVLFTGLTMYFLCSAAMKSAKKNDLSYYSVCTDAYPFLGPLADFFITFLSIASPLAYLGLVTDSLSRLFLIENYRIFVLMGVAVLSFLLSSQKDLSSLRWASYLSVTSVICLSIFVMYIFKLNHVNTTVKTFSTDYSNSIGQILFAVGCQQNMVSVYSQLRNRSLSSIIQLIFMTCLIGPLLYFMVGFFGYYGMGEESKNDLLEILTKSDSKIQKLLYSQGQFQKILVHMVVIAFDITLLVSTAFQINPGKKSIGNLLHKFAGFSQTSINSTKFHLISTFMIVAFGVILNAFEVDTQLVVSLVGGIACNGICYILPSLAFIGTNKKSPLKPLAVITAMLGISSLLYITGNTALKQLK